MELYLFHQVYIQALIKNTFRVTTHFDIASFTKSISEICKSLFFIRSYIAHESGTLVDIHKDLSYNRKTNVCSFNSESYLTKLIQRNKFTVSLEDFNNEIHNKIKNATEDVRLLIKGHDFIHILYECIRKLKKVSMSEDELANTFWIYLDSKQLRTEPLFQKIANL